MKIFTTIAAFIRAKLIPITRTYRHQFGNGIVVKARLSTWGTGSIEFSEPLPPWLREDFEKWIGAVTEHFQKRTGVTVDEFDEDARPLPQISARKIAVMREQVRQGKL